MGIMQKRKFRNLVVYIYGFDKENPKTWGPMKEPEKQTTKELFSQFGIDDNSQDIAGHALALYRNEE